MSVTPIVIICVVAVVCLAVWLVAVRKPRGTSPMDR